MRHDSTFDQNVSTINDSKGRDYVRWCFADPHVAAQFVNEFGGAVGKLD
jgi:hypothetical protein